MNNLVSSSGYPQLLRVIRYVRNRWRLRNTLKGAAFLLVFGLAAFAVSAWGMEYFRYSPWSVTLFRAFTYLALLGFLLRFVLRPLARRVTNEQVALYMEEHDKSLHEAITSAIELGAADADRDVDAGGRGDSRMREGLARSSELVEKLVEQTVERCESIDYGHDIEQDQLKRSSGILLAVALAGMLAVLASPGFMKHGAALLLNPMRSAQAASPYAILVSPGDVALARGADQLVTAELQGFESEEITISVSATDDEDASVRTGASDATAGWRRWPMSLDEETGSYSFMLFDLDSATDYYVEANGVRSELFRVDVSDLPYVRQIDLLYQFPDYTGLTAQTIEDGGDIAVLGGTTVELTIYPTVKVAGGVLAVEGKEPVPLVGAEDGSWAASYTVLEDGFYRIDLEAFDGTLKVASPDYAIEVLTDQPPSVTITKPGRDSKVNPIEEVFTEVRGEDDYGLARLELVYSVNGGEEQVVSLYRGRGKKELVAGHTFFLEDFELEAGDFISYYARATDAQQVGGPETATTDIYFLEARPFDRRYSQAQGGMPGGGGGGGGMEGTLSVRQREIVAATFKLIRDKKDFTKRDWEENLTTVALMQGRLRDQVSNLLRRMTNRGITGMDGDFGKISESLGNAIEAMGPAEEKLTAKDPDDAMPFEQKALQHLQRADAVFRDVQVSFQSGGGGGGGQAASAEDLADLFELELDKLRNQYETVQRGQQQSLDNEVDEALQRLQELARRQQQENERMRRQASRMQQGGGGAGGTQRDLAEEAEELARKLERLSRENSLPDLQDTARRLQQAADSMRRAAARGDAGAIAEGLGALDRLKDARRLLDKNRSVRLERDMEDALEQAERIASQQSNVEEDVRRLGQEGGRVTAAGAERLRRIFERKDELAQQVAELESQLDRMARESRRDQKEASRQIQDAANSIRDTKLKEKIRYSKGVVQGRSPQYAENFEQVIEEDIESLRERLGQAAGSIGQSPESQVTEAIEQTRDLVRNLESLSERIRERREMTERGLDAERSGQGEGESDREGEGQGPGQRESEEGRRPGSERLARSEGRSESEGQGQDQGQGQGQGQNQTQSSDQSQGEGQGEGEGEGRGSPSPSASGQVGPTSIGAGSPDGPGYQPGQFSSEEMRQIRREFRERVSEAEGLRQELARQNLEVPDLSEIIRRMEEFDRKQIYLNPLGLEQLEEDVLTELKQFEFWLRRELEGLSEEELFLAGSDRVPANYRTLVEEYFRSLSRQEP